MRREKSLEGTCAIVIPSGERERERESEREQQIFYFPKPSEETLGFPAEFERLRLFLHRNSNVPNDCCVQSSKPVFAFSIIDIIFLSFIKRMIMVSTELEFFSLSLW